MITNIFAHLVYPTKGAEPPKGIQGSAVPLSGSMFDLLNDIYVGSEEECSIGVGLNHSESGAQQSAVRDELMKLASAPSLPNAEAMAIRLSQSSTRRSGPGLLFSIVANKDGETILLLSRFPTDKAILAEETGGALNVTFLEKVFVKNKFSYKGALFKGNGSRSSFWSGHVIDRQINSMDGEASQYWVKNFLQADFITTGELGTKRFARALTNASAKATLDTKPEINAVASLVNGFAGRSKSAERIVHSLQLSDEATALIKREMGKSYGETFEFDKRVFKNTIGFRTISLKNGVSVTANSAEFKELIEIEEVDGKGLDYIRLIAEGEYSTDRLRRRG